LTSIADRSSDLTSDASFLRFISISEFAPRNGSETGGLSWGLVRVSLQSHNLKSSIRLYVAMLLAWERLYFYEYSYLQLKYLVPLRLHINNHLPLKNKTNSMALVHKANYTDRATAACRRSYCQL
jgi:hypothetical protein